MSSRMEAMMMRAAVVACGAALAVGTAVAQDQTPPPPPQGQTQGPPPGGPGGRGGMMNPERRLEMMQHELNLSGDQTAQIKAIYETERSKMEALRSSTAGPQERRAQMMAIHEDGVSKIRSVLTPDQKPRFDAMEARMRERMQERREGTAPPPPPPPPGV